jgi:hypothetical protein
VRGITARLDTVSQLSQTRIPLSGKAGAHTWHLLLASSATCLFLAASTASASPQATPLHLASRAGYSILVPDGWQFRDRTGLSDHLTHVYRDPVNHRRRLVVTVSTCVGCVMKNVASMDFRPDPAKVLPPGVRSQTLLTKWKLAYRAFWGGNPTPTMASS